MAGDRDKTDLVSRRRVIQAVSGLTGLSTLIAFSNCKSVGTAGNQSLASSSADPAATTDPGQETSLSIVDFGADPSGKLDSSPAIQACLDAAGGRPIIVPIGNFVMKSPVTSSLPIQLFGSGPGAGFPQQVQNCSRLICDFSSGHQFAVTAYQGSEIHGIQFASNVSRADGACLHFAPPTVANVENVKIHNCAFYNAAVAIDFYCPSQMDVYSNFFYGWSVAAISSSTAATVEGGAGFIHHNYLVGNNDSSLFPPYGVYCEHGYLNVSDNVIINSAIAIGLNIKNYPAGGIKIHHNWIENNTEFGVLVQSNDGNKATLVAISQNEFSNYAYAAQMVASVAVADFNGASWISIVNVTGNQFRNSFNGASKNIWVASGDQVNVSGNQINNFGSGTGGYGIQVTGDAVGPYCAVIDNQIVGTFTQKYNLKPGIFKRDNHGD